MTKIIKSISFLFLLIIPQIALSQSSISFNENGLQSALDKAKAGNKPVMLWCYATWCPHCKQMKAEVFTNQTVADYFDKTFICVAQDMEKKEGLELNKELKIKSFPTFVFYSSNGEIIYRVEGELKPAAFVAEGKNALTPKKQLPYLKQQFMKDVSNSINCYTYLRSLKKGGLDVSAVANQYFATQSDKQLVSEMNWRIFANGVTDFNSREMQFVINHQKEFAAITSSERVKRKLDYEVTSLLNPLVEVTDTVNYPIKRKLAVEIHSYSTDSLIFNYDLKIWELTQNWSAYLETCLASSDTFAWNNSPQLSDIANNFLKHTTNTKALLKVESWAQRSLTLNKSYDNYLLCSRLYQKLNNKAEAIKMAKKAMDMATKFGWEGTESEKLLNELNVINK